MFPPFDPSKVSYEIEQTTPSKWDPSLNPPRASLLSHEILQSLAHSHSHSEHTSYSAPPQTQTFPSYLNCLHEFGPIASAPPQIESFPSEPLPSSSRLTEDLPRKSSVATTESNKPFLELEQSDSTSASLRSDYSYSVLDRPSIDSTRSNERFPRKKPSMHQRIRSLLSPPSPRPNSQPLPYPVSPRVSTTQAIPTRARPSSPTPSTATTSSRLTRSNAYRSLGRALLGKDPKSPVLETTFPSSEISYAQRVVLETLSASAVSPVPSSTFSLNSRQKERIGDDLRFLASTSSSSSPALLLQPKEGTKTFRISTIKKKLSSRMLEFFHDNDESASSPASTPTTTTAKLTKEKRRPQALSIASSNLLAVNAKIESRPPSLVKKLSSFALGSSRSSQPLAPPSPLTLNSPTPTSSNFNQSDTPSSIIASLQSYPLRSSPHSSRRPISEPSLFPVHPNPSIHRRSTLSTTLSPPASHWSPDTSTSSSSSQLSTLRSENSKLRLENKLLRSTLDSKEEEIKLLKRREETMMRLIEEALESRGKMGRERSKTSLLDEESLKGTEEEWVESLKGLERGVFAE